MEEQFAFKMAFQINKNVTDTGIFSFNKYLILANTFHSKSIKEWMVIQYSACAMVPFDTGILSDMQQCFTFKLPKPIHVCVSIHCVPSSLISAATKDHWDAKE